MVCQLLKRKELYSDILSPKSFGERRSNRRQEIPHETPQQQCGSTRCESNAYGFIPLQVRQRQQTVKQKGSGAKHSAGGPMTIVIGKSFPIASRQIFTAFPNTHGIKRGFKKIIWNYTSWL